MISISIRDEGPGIKDENSEDLFKPFYTTREGGTGLGLANAKKIVEYHDGTMQAGNHPDGGAVFTIMIPVTG